MPSASPPSVPDLATELEAGLQQQYGPLMGGETLFRALGYGSMELFRLSLSRGQVPVPVFPIPRRHGKFALTKDVAHWLAERRSAAQFPTNHVAQEGTTNQPANQPTE